MSRLDAHQRRQRRKRAEANKERRRAHRLELAVSVAEAQAAIKGAEEYFLTYYKEQDPTPLTWILGATKQFSLLSQPDYKYEFAVGIATVYREHPEHQVRWRKEHQQVLFGALHLWPDPDEEDEIDMDAPGRVLQCLVAWNLTRDWSFINAILDVSEDDEHPDCALAHQILDQHREDHPDEWAELDAEARQPEQVVELPTNIRKLMQGLTDYILAGPDRHRLVFINYDKGQVTIATRDDKLDGGFGAWKHHVRIIKHRQATVAEIEAYERQQVAESEPV